MAQENTDDLSCGYAELVKARPDYERAAAMYDGSVEEIYSSPKVTQLLAKFGLDSIESMNFAHIPVDAVANKLRLNAVTVDDQDQEAEPTPRKIKNVSNGGSGQDSSPDESFSVFGTKQ